MSTVRTLLKTPQVAWPTVALWLALLAGWAMSFWLAYCDRVPVWCSSIASTLFAFWIFTPIHEASHNLIARSQRANLVVGHTGGAVLMIPFLAFRHAHQEHHRHTNDPNRDPDHYSGRGPRWLLPFRWITIDLHYYRWMQKREGGLVFFLVLGLVATALCYLGYAQTVFFCWLVPARVAIGLVAFSFSYFPHAPHKVTTKQDRYRASNILLHPGLTPLLLCQNYHLVHHLYPGVPFYRYSRIFAAKREELIERGAPIYPRSQR